MLQERRGEGTSNGTFRSVEYFRCNYNCGMFVSMDKLVNPEHKNIPSPVAVDAPLKLGDGVIIFDTRDKQAKGTVRWIGMNRVAKPNGDTLVGIEMVI